MTGNSAGRTYSTRPRGLVSEGFVCGQLSGLLRHRLLGFVLPAVRIPYSRVKTALSKGERMEIAKIILAYLPQYLSDFGFLISGPKKFMAQENSKAQADAFHNALAFLGLSLVVVVFIQAAAEATFLSPVPRKALWTYIVGVGIPSVLSVSLISVALRLAWRIVGGKSTVRAFFITYSYFYSGIYVILMILTILNEGIMRFINYDYYEYIMNMRIDEIIIETAQGTIKPNPNLASDIVSKIIVSVMFLFSPIWAFISWGAYRQLNKLSKWRSFFAFIIFAVFEIPIVFIIFFISSGLR